MCVNSKQFDKKNKDCIYQLTDFYSLFYLKFIKDNKNAIQVYAQIISNKMFTSWVYIFAFLACGQWCFITMISFLYRNKMGLNPQEIGGFMTLSALFFIMGTLTANKILKYQVIMVAEIQREKFVYYHRQC